VAGLATLAGCATVSIVPFEECSTRDLLVELPADRLGSTVLEQQYHATAGCTITFEVRRSNPLASGPDAHLWDPLSGVNYELRVEPEGPLGRLERGALPEDGRVIVATVEGNTSVQLTIFPPGIWAKETALVLLDQ